MQTKYRGYYSLTTISDKGQVNRSPCTTEFEVDEFEHPGARLRQIAYAAMENSSALGVSIEDFNEIS